jgi:hypothetical protein
VEEREGLRRVKEIRIFEPCSEFTKRLEGHADKSRVLMTLLDIFGDDLQRYSKVVNKPPNIYNSEYNSRLNIAVKDILDLVRTLHKYEDMYNKQLIDSNLYEEKKNQIIGKINMRDADGYILKTLDNISII